ncbi:MAG: division/cell wall cluster transcriptional repressor MraZ [Bacteroidales bacterium]|nr:division/cell wall cluster transcriptional repressor MraZ [Candidatus Physcousia equi]
MRFTGNSDAKADAKGRIFLPAAFRKLLTQSGEEGLVMRRDIFQKCLVLYPRSVWDRMLDQVVASTSPFNGKGRDVMRRLVAGTENLSLDSDGRILIPRRYLEMAGITSEVRFIGMDDTIEIWNRQAADALLESEDQLALDMEALMNTTLCNHS